MTEKIRQESCGYPEAVHVSNIRTGGGARPGVRAERCVARFDPDGAAIRVLAIRRLCTRARHHRHAARIGRRAGSGDVVIEGVVRRNGSIGDVKILQGLPNGLNERAVETVRQWTFAPAQRQGAPVDVIVEVAVEFTRR